MGFCLKSQILIVFFNRRTLICSRSWLQLILGHNDGINFKLREFVNAFDYLGHEILFPISFV
ncbi:Uncharacterised protein [Mycobacteroides abscessus subsp. abscessus]|nr:Uncharacterised protein [Mycobacteroides abscessus subsp. abscessus]